MGETGRLHEASLELVGLTRAWPVRRGPSHDTGTTARGRRLNLPGVDGYVLRCRHRDSGRVAVDRIVPAFAGLTR